MTIYNALNLLEFKKVVYNDNPVPPVVSKTVEPINTGDLVGETSRQGEYNFAGSMRQANLLANENPTVPTPVPVPEAETPTPQPTSTAIPTETPTATPAATPTTSPAAVPTTLPAATLTLEETKSISDIAYDGQVGEVYQLPDGTNWRVDDVETDPSGFRAVVTRRVIPNPDGSGTYIDDPTDNRVVVGFAGTNALDDWNDNIAQGLGLTPKQYDQALAFTNEVQQNAAASGETVVLTGHSLGGGLATYSAIETGLPATAINSAPLDNGKVPDDVSYDGQITQYYAEGEILTDLDNANPFDSRPGTHIEVDGSYDEVSIFDGMDWHDWLHPEDKIADNIEHNIEASINNHSLDNTAPEVAAPIRVYP